MILDFYTDTSRRDILMRFQQEQDGSITIYLREPLDRINLLPQEVKMVKQFLELDK